MKKRIISKPLIILLVMACLVACIPGVYSYMIRRTENITNTLVPAYVDCTVYEEFDGANKTNVTIMNDSNIETYIRVRIVSYWVDSKGAPIAKASPTVAVNWGSTNWIFDASNQTYYYREPVAPGSSTSDLLNGTTIKLQDDKITADNGTEFTYHQVVEFIAEAIQSNPENAVETSWNVIVNDNKITAVN